MKFQFISVQIFPLVTILIDIAASVNFKAFQSLIDQSQSYDYNLKHPLNDDGRSAELSPYQKFKRSKHPNELKFMEDSFPIFKRLSLKLEKSPEKIIKKISDADLLAIEKRTKHESTYNTDLPLWTMFGGSNSGSGSLALLKNYRNLDSLYNDGDDYY